MIQGIGTDLADVTRFSKFKQHKLDQLAKKIMTEPEYLLYSQQSSRQQPGFVARHWAVKESVAKSFGTGLVAPVRFKNIELYRAKNHAPRVRLLNDLSKYRCMISISHEHNLVTAFAVLLK